MQPITSNVRTLVLGVLVVVVAWYVTSGLKKAGLAVEHRLFGLNLGGPDDKGAILYLPPEQRLKNTGGSDGSGLCVFTSLTHAARYQNVDALKEFQAWMKTKPGGGYPQKVDDMINRMCKEHGTDIPRYFQYEGMDVGMVRRVIESGRMACVTYDGRDMHYRQHVEHMVNVVGFTADYVVVLDNNFVGENEFVYLTPEEFRSRWIGIGGRGRQGWLVCLLDPGRPPVFKDAKTTKEELQAKWTDLTRSRWPKRSASPAGPTPCAAPWRPASAG